MFNLFYFGYFSFWIIFVNHLHFLPVLKYKHFLLRQFYWLADVFYSFITIFVECSTAVGAFEPGPAFVIWPREHTPYSQLLAPTRWPEIPMAFLFAVCCLGFCKWMNEWHFCSCVWASNRFYYYCACRVI